MNIPGIGFDKTEPNLKPVFTSKDDGLEYYGEYLADIGIGLPFAVSARYPATHPVTWALKGLITGLVEIAWIFSIGLVCLLLGLILILVGESWNEMQSR